MSARGGFCILLGVAVVLGGAAWFASSRWFRTETNEGAAGRFEVEFRWGRPVGLRYDKDRDGGWDYRAILSDGRSPMSVPPREFWDDEDLNGCYEIHAVMTGSVDEPVDVWELDRTEDGDFEVRLTGAEAQRAYEDWLGRRQVRRLPAGGS